MLISSTINDCKIIELGKIHNTAGHITPIEGLVDVPFEIKRVYYLYDIPSGESRGGHAHKELYQLLLSGSGSFDIILDDSIDKRVVSLNRPNIGLLIVPGIWRELQNFSSGSICLVFASEYYNEQDYIRGYEIFKSTKSI